MKHERYVEAERLLDQTLEQFPDYIFAKCEKAKLLIQNNEFDAAIALMGNTPDLPKMYPDTKIFHEGVVCVYYSFFVELEIARKNFKKADEYISLIKDDERIEIREHFGERYIMESRHAELLHRKTLERNPEYIQPEAPQGYSYKPFVHKEIEILFTEIETLENEDIDAILALPRHTAIDDLLQIMYRSLIEVDSDDLNYNALPHAIWFLYAMQATECLDFAKYLLQISEDEADNFYGDDLVEKTWFLHFMLLEKGETSLLDVLYKPNLSDYAKSPLSVAMVQVALHYPERRSEVIAWFDKLLQFYIDNIKNDDIIDSAFIGFVEADLLDIKAVELLPKLKILHEMQCVNEMICGDYNMVVKEIQTNNENHKRTLPTIYELAEGDRFSFHQQEERDFQSFWDEQEPYTREEPKIGRNDPCPCGSGKKYKKCCGK
jgi:hypothetical protein